MFTFSEKCNYSMPAHFGGVEGHPRSCTYSDVTSIQVSYETDPEMLAQYIPDQFEITQPVVVIGYVMNRGVDWLGGGSYNLIAVNVPAAYRHGGQRIEGAYALVVWENKTCPILGGREQTGVPKIFANIEDHHQLGNRLFTNASYEGSEFLRIDFTRTSKMGPNDLDALNRQQGKLNWFGWRYIPNIGQPGAALSHATLYPVEFDYTAGWRGEGNIHWTATPQRHPTQAHIIAAMSRFPIRAYRDCTMTLSSQVLRIDLARQLP